MHYDIGAYDMKYDEFKEMCHVAWTEKFNYLGIDLIKNKNEGKYRNSMKVKTHILNAFPKKKFFKNNHIHILLYVVFN